MAEQTPSEQHRPFVEAQQAWADARSNVLYIAKQQMLFRPGTDLYRMLSTEFSIAQQDSEYCRAALDRGDFDEVARKAEDVCDRAMSVHAILS